MRADEVPRGRGPPKHATDTSAREGFGLGLAARAASGLEGRQRPGRRLLPKSSPQRAARLACRAASAALEDRGLRFLLLFSLQKGTKEA